MSLPDWPFQYEDLEPYLTRIEWEFGISGIAGAENGEGFFFEPGEIGVFIGIFFGGHGERRVEGWEE